MTCVCVRGFIWLWRVFVLQGPCDYDVCLCNRIHMTMTCVCVTGFIWLWRVFVLQGSYDYDVCLCYRVWRSWTRRRPRGRFRPLTPSTSPAPPASTNSRRRTRDPLTSAIYRQISRCVECAKFWKATEIKHIMTSLLWIKIIHIVHVCEKEWWTSRKKCTLL